MKRHLFAPPCLALIVVGAWVGTKRVSLASIEHESVALREQIARASSTRADATASAKPTPDHAPPDWKKIGARIVESQAGWGMMADLRGEIRLAQRLEKMSAAEILAALDEIATLSLSTSSRAALEKTLFDRLVEMDPGATLERYADRIGGRDHPGDLSGAFKSWAQKDLSRAAAWFDQQIAAGKFDCKSLDGRNQSRLNFENALMDSLLFADPAAASLRLSTLSENMRTQILAECATSVGEERQVTFAEFVRANLPEEGQTRAISQLASRLVQSGGYEKVSAYLDRIDATHAERKRSVEGAAWAKIANQGNRKPISREDLDPMRTWVNSQFPESTDNVTGKALGSAGSFNGGAKFTAALELAKEYSAASGNDEVLASFLESCARDRSIHGQIRPLAGTISDPTRREKILSLLK